MTYVILNVTYRIRLFCYLRNVRANFYFGIQDYFCVRLHFVSSYVSVFLGRDVELSITYVYTSNMCNEIEISAIECLSIPAAKLCV